MRPAKLFMYTSGSWPYLTCSCAMPDPMSEIDFAIRGIKAEGAKPFAGWLLDFEANMVYGAYLPAQYKELLAIYASHDVERLWSEVVSKSAEGAMSAPLPDFAVAVSGWITGEGRWGLLDLESDLQSDRDLILSASVLDTQLTTAIHQALETVTKLKQDLVPLMLRPELSLPINAPSPAFDGRPFEGKDAAATVVHDGTAKDRSIKAPHYQHFFKEYQWIEVQQGKPHMRKPGHFMSALHMQVDKYLDRLGRKDDETQEMRKACFYLGFMIMYAEEGEGNCVRVHEWLDALGKKKE